MVAVALDLQSFQADILTGSLVLADTPRLARDCGCNALSIPSSALLTLDTLGAYSLGQELRRTGVVVVAIQCDTLAPGASTFAADTLHLCRRVVEGHRDASFLCTTPDEVQSMAAYNTLASQLGRASRISAEWCLRLLISNENGLGWMSAVTLCQDIKGLGLAPSLDLLPVAADERVRAMEMVLPLARLARVVAYGNADDARVLPAWRSWLDNAGWGGVCSVAVHPDVGGDRYRAAGQAVAHLKSSPKTGVKTP